MAEIYHRIARLPRRILEYLVSADAAPPDRQLTCLINPDQSAAALLP